MFASFSLLVVLFAEMSLRSAFLVALSKKSVSGSFFLRFAQQLEKEVWKNQRSWMRNSVTLPPYWDLVSIDRVRYVVRLAWKWLKTTEDGIFVRYPHEHGVAVERTWADFAYELQEIVEENGFSRNTEATYDCLVELLVHVAFWGDEAPSMVAQDMENIAQLFIHMFLLALGDPPSPQPINVAMEADADGEGSGEPQPEAVQFGEGSGEPQPEAVQFGEGSGEPQPEAVQFGEGSGEPQPEAVQFGEGSGEPQPEAVQFGEGSGEPQPEAVQFGEGILEPQPEAVQFGEGILEPQPEAVQFGDGIAEPQPEAEEIGEGILEHQPEAEEPATRTSVERSGARRRLTGVPMDTDAVRGVKRYRLRETYEREMARYKSARRRYDLRDTPTRQERLADMEQDLKRGRNVGSAQPRKRSRL